MAETERDYKELQQMIKGIRDEIDLPRCANCDYELNGQCTKFNQPIPAEYLYKYTDCKEWIYGIPF